MRRMPVVGLVPRVSLGIGLFAALASSWQSWQLVRERTVPSGEIAVAHDQSRLSQEAITNTQAGVPSAEILRIQRELQQETAALQNAEAREKELSQRLPNRSEQMRSVGRIQELGYDTVTFMQGMSKMLQREKINWGEIAEAAIKWNTQLDLISEMEDYPAEIAELHSSILRESLKLDDATVAKVRAQLEKEFSQLSSAGLTRSQRPAEDSEQWYQKRGSFLAETTKRIEALLPAENRDATRVARVLALGAAFRTTYNEKHGAVLTFQLPGLKVSSWMNKPQ